MLDYRKLLEELVNCNSWSHNRAGIERANQIILDALSYIPGVQVEQAQFNDKPAMLIARNIHRDGQPNILLLGHIDTVHMPDKAKLFTLEGSHVEGDGCEDMKGGLVVMLGSLIKLQNKPYNITLIINVDEEIGSTSYESELAKLYSDLDLALVYEGGEYAEGSDNVRSLITKRKGVVGIEVSTIGKAGHSGVLTNPADRLSSNLEMVYKLAEIQHLEEQFRTVSVNIGKIVGGHADNVVSEVTDALFEVRSFDRDEMVEAMRLTEEILNKTFRPGVKTEYKVLHYFKPLTSDGVQAEKLALLSQKLAEGSARVELGQRGGGSDANKVREYNQNAVIIDGLGPVGGKSHTKEEWIDISTIESSIDLTIEIVDKYSEVR